MVCGHGEKGGWGPPLMGDEGSSPAAAASATPVDARHGSAYDAHTAATAARRALSVYFDVSP